MFEFKFDDSGFKDLMKDLDKRSKRAQELEGEHQVTFDELFPVEFMRSNTHFDSIDNFLISAGIDPKNQESFDSYPQDKLDKFTEENTNFSSWEAMIQKATNQLASKWMGF